MATFSPLDFRNTNTLWASVLVETLVRLGARQAVTCPGSRSTPLTIALARHPRLETHPVLDERSAAFLALGLARRRHVPTVLVCTSGTAAANFLPAIIEAQESRVPLLVLTADRPPEMRDCRSGQTIDQLKLYGGHVNFFHELAVPAPTVPALRYVRQLAIQAWDRALAPVAGPVHVNCPFRDPLPPVPDGRTDGLAARLRPADFFRAVRPLSAPESVPAPAAVRAVLGGGARRGLIIAGPAQPADPARYGRAVARLARASGWPVLADVLSPVREAAGPGFVPIAAYDMIVRSAAQGAALRPERVLVLGEWPTSKRLRAWLEEAEVEAVFVGDEAGDADALHVRSRRLRGSVEALAAARWPAPAAPAAWRRAWQQAEAAAQRGLDRQLRTAPARFEGRVARLLARHLPRGTAVFVANSMPVRDLEYFWPAGRGRRPVLFNRGANGIDGTLSTALGVAHGQGPVVLVTGDLAFLHDSNGLLFAPRFRGRLTVLVINNAGGGIFEHLPVARFDPPFEEYFATPQAVSLAGLCAAHGVAHVQVRDWARLPRLLAAPPPAGVRVLEVRTDRKRDAACRQALLAAVAAALD